MISFYNNKNLKISRIFFLANFVYSKHTAKKIIIQQKSKAIKIYLKHIENSNLKQKKNYIEMDFEEKIFLKKNF